MALTRTSDTAGLVVVAPRRNVREHVREILGYTELIRSLVRKELKVRYKQSTLGLVWSMIQPMFLLLIYSVVFSVLKGGMPRLGVWIMSGLLLWTMVGTSVTTAVVSITGNGPLVGKVRFPRAALPTASIGAALIHFCLQFSAFCVVLLVVQQHVDWTYVWLIPFAVASVLIFLLAVGLLVSAVNVYARDSQHLLDMLTLGWFWLTPIIFDYARLSRFFQNHGLPAWLPMVNPITPAVIIMQRAIYGTAYVNGGRVLPDASVWWYLRNLGIVAAFSVVLLYVALRLFDRAEVNMAESL